MKRFRIKGMSCAACQARVEKAVSGVPGVTSCAVSLITDSMNVEGSASDSDIIKAVKRAGYSAETSDVESRDSRAAENPRDASRELKIRLAVSAGLLVILMYITMGHGMLGLPLPAFFSDNHVALGLVQMLLAFAVMAVNRRFFTHGFGSLMRGGPNMDTLVALGSSVSFVWSLFLLFKMTELAAAGDSSAISEIYHGGLYFETAAMIPALITVGKLLESIAKGKTRGALEGLIRLTPKKARKLVGGVETEVEAASLAVGDLFALRPGDSVPVDGVVAEGESAIDESALTGESVPADKKPGDTVSAATVNKSGYLVCRATRVGEDTSLSRIIRLVSDASATKAPSARVADRVSAVFVPAVIG
ncbi:MAG: heavy metal translocating P-type ATPase, partial [Clostridia bacterium]|nr:heavy metal translocating P-type ATPase [Clostridia bacterium]